MEKEKRKDNEPYMTLWNKYKRGQITLLELEKSCKELQNKVNCCDIEPF